MKRLRTHRRALAALAALASAGLMIWAVYTLNRPDYVQLLEGLRSHVLGFFGFAAEDPFNAVILHLKGLAMVRTPELTQGVLLTGFGLGMLFAALGLSAHPVDWFTPIPPTVLLANSIFQGRVTDPPLQSLRFCRGGFPNPPNSPPASPTPFLRWRGKGGTPPPVARGIGVIRRWPVIVGVALLAWLAESNGQLLGISFLAGTPTHAQFGLLCAGVILVTWGLGGGAWPRLSLSAADRRDALLLAGITAGALALRAWDLEQSVHRFIDEVHYLAGINALHAEPDTPLLARFSHITAFPYLYPYLQSLSAAVFGRSLTAIRLVSAVFGTLTVPALYCLGRTLFNRQTGLLAALFLAAYPPHIHFSRLGINNIADPLFGVLALALLARGLRDHRRADFALAGAALGLTQYFYEGGRLLYPPLVLLWLAGVWLVWRPAVPLRGIAVMLLVALIVAAPVYYTLVGDNNPLDPRMQTAGVGSRHLILALFSENPGIWQAQLWHTLFAFLAYIYLPDISWFYSDRNPLLLAYAAPVALLGLGVALWRWRTPGGLLLVLWIVTATLPQSLLIDSTWAPRFVVVFPALALLVALGITETLRVIWVIPHPPPHMESERTGRRKIGRFVGAGLRPAQGGSVTRPYNQEPQSRHEPSPTSNSHMLTGKKHTVVSIARGLVAGALVITLAVVQVRYYFGDYLEHFNAFIRSGYDGEDALFRALDLPPGTQVHIVDELILWPLNVEAVLGFWNADLTVAVILPDNFTRDYLAQLPRDVPQAFFIDPTDQASIDLLHSEFHTTPPLYSRHNVPRHNQLALFYAPAPTFD